MSEHVQVGDLEDDELLSIGQSHLVLQSLFNDGDCDGSIYVHQGKSDKGTPYRALALYDVQHNMLGLDVPWPGARWPSEEAATLLLRPEAPR
jgi:hypothetical protein